MSKRPVMPPVPEGCPKYTVWLVTAQKHHSHERQTRWVKFTGEPLKAEMDYFCPPDVCVITEMRFLYAIWNDDE